MKRWTILMITAALAVASCDDQGTGPDAEDQLPEGGKADDNDADGIDTRGYHFVLSDAEFTVRRDHAGAPLLATIWGRIAEYSAEAPCVEEHAYNDTNDGIDLPWLAHITKRFHTVHSSWAPSFEAMGLDTCDVLGLNDDWWDGLFTEDGINLDALEPEQCFGQRMQWPNPETGENESYRRTIQVALPDYLTIELDEPASFPNGRVLHEQINSLMFAMAFLDQGGECTDQQGKVSDCDLHTLWRRTDFLKQQNDVPFAGAAAIGDAPRVFPYLAPAHRVD